MDFFNSIADICEKPSSSVTNIAKDDFAISIIMANTLIKIHVRTNRITKFGSQNSSTELKSRNSVTLKGC